MWRISFVVGFGWSVNNASVETILDCRRGGKKMSGFGDLEICLTKLLFRSSSMK